jgi:thymidylate synthase (FAD)
MTTVSLSVRLLAHTPRPDALVAAAARLCYSDAAIEDLLKRESAEPSARLLDELRESGHHSPFEHASFTFGVEGLSRVASHQLVRHRIASFSQQSQRYVKRESAEIVLPPSAAARPEARTLFERQAESAREAYKALLGMGVPPEDARFVLPHGCATRLLFTMNIRELLHFFELRLCRRAQWEIRELARRMLLLCREAAPISFSAAGPSCIAGECREARTCGRPYKNREDLLRENERNDS